MFSLRAREKFRQRGSGPAAFFGFFAWSWQESLGELRAHRNLARALVRFGALCAVFLPALLVPVYLPGLPGAWWICAAVTALGVALATLWCLLYTGLLRPPESAAPVSRFGIANYLTLLRFYLIAPLVVLLSQGRFRPALAVYLLAGLTDVIDGMVARRRSEQTEFGIVMDPLADVFSTAAVFATLFAMDIVPGWLFALLMVRYGMLIAGSLAFFLFVGPLRFRATIPGKVVGVLQAAGVTAIVVALVAGEDAPGRLGTWLFPFLGLCFASIVVSQAVIAVKQARGLRTLSDGK